MFNFLNKPKRPGSSEVKLTQEQEQEMLRFDTEEWPKPPLDIGRDSLVYFIGDGNLLTPAVVKAVYKEDKFTEYRVMYKVDSVKRMKAADLFLTKEDAVRNAIGQHWQDIQRLYKGMLDAGTVLDSVKDYTEQKIDAHKRIIKFLESQLLEKETANDDKSSLQQG